MRNFRLVSAMAVVLMGGLLVSACGGKPGPEKQREALVAEWKKLNDAMLADPKKDVDVSKVTQIAQQLASLGPTGIDPLLEILADPNSNPRTKMLVTMSLTTAMAKENMPKVIALTDAKYDVNTRVNAAHLVSIYGDPELEAVCDKLMEDPEIRVRLQIFHMRLMRQDPRALAVVDQIWADPDTPVADKMQIVQGLLERDAPQHMQIFLQAVPDPQIAPIARERAVTILGRLGDASAVPVLEKASQEDLDPKIKEVAKTALEALKARLDGSVNAPAEAPAAPAETPAAASPTPEAPATPAAQ